MRFSLFFAGEFLSKLFGDTLGFCLVILFTARSHVEKETTGVQALEVR